MNKIRVLFLSAQPVVVAALLSFFFNDSFIIPDVEEYRNYLHYRKNISGNYQVMVFDDGALEQHERENLNSLISHEANAKKILYSEKNDKEYFDYYLNCEIDGIVSKKAEMGILKDAVLRVVNDNKYYCKHVSEILSLKKEESDRTELLTQREKEILCMVANGFKNCEIAEKLYLSPRTIETHKTHIVRKLELKSTMELVRYAVKNYEMLKTV